MTSGEGKKEVLAIRRYIRYVTERVGFFRSGLLLGEDNEISYYCTIKKEIVEFMENHQVFCKYVFGKIDISGAKKILGIDYRRVLRFLKKQREKFINQIQEAEIVAFAKFPFKELGCRVSIG